MGVGRNEDLKIVVIFLILNKVVSMMVRWPLFRDVFPFLLKPSSVNLTVEVCIPHQS